MKKILASFGMIALVAAATFGLTRAFFSDTETSVDNTFTAGTIDISVDGENPWTNSWANYLDKPSQTNYMNFTVQNVGENPAKLFKKLTAIVNGPGEPMWPETGTKWASSEQEYTDGGGLYDTDGNGNQTPNGSGYVERDNISAFMIYDMSVCVKGAPLGVSAAPCVCDVEEVPGFTGDKSKGKPITEGTCWKVIVDENDQVRVDNVADSWIELTAGMTDGLALDAEMVVSQSYHLATWDDSNQPIITNWAQGDTMKFNMVLEARQLTAPAPGQEGMVTAKLVAKNTTTWDPNPTNGEGTITYDPSEATFKYSYAFTGLDDGLSYQLIYYPDPWASPKTVVNIGTIAAPVSGVSNGSGDVELGMDIPNSATDFDANFPVGGKVWLVPTASMNVNDLNWTNVDKFLFDLNMVKYDDTQI